MRGQNLLISERLKAPYQDGIINQVITIYEIRARAA